MRILIIDRDEASGNFALSRFQAMGHDAVYQPSKSDALHMLERDSFDVIFIDPSPLTSARQVLLNIRRVARNYPYIFLWMPDVNLEDGIKTSANDVLPKPCGAELFAEKLKNAEALLTLVSQLGDESEDFPSAGGVIAKSAFNQLFLAAMDRADRYGEQTYILFIGVENFAEILQLDGKYAADFLSASLSRFLVIQRRTSDIIGQTKKAEYALLLQRPAYETEPLEAAKRFAEAFKNHTEEMLPSTGELRIEVSLVAVPTGHVAAHYMIVPGKEIR